jgi:hypothetical protein
VISVQCMHVLIQIQTHELLNWSSSSVRCHFPSSACARYNIEDQMDLIPIMIMSQSEFPEEQNHIKFQVTSFSSACVLFCGHYCSRQSFSKLLHSTHLHHRIGAAKTEEALFVVESTQTAFVTNFSNLPEGGRSIFNVEYQYEHTYH